MSAWAQNSASNIAPASVSRAPVQAASLQNGAERVNGPSSRIILSTPSPSTALSAGQRASSSPPPSTDTAATSFSQGEANYRGQYSGSDGAEFDYTPVVVVPHGADRWAGPVMPDERDRGPRRLSMEERLRLRSDIRDASRNMYEHPRPR
jgi:hypothetical protein